MNDGDGVTVSARETKWPLPGTLGLPRLMIEKLRVQRHHAISGLSLSVRFAVFCPTLLPFEDLAVVLLCRSQRELHSYRLLRGPETVAISSQTSFCLKPLDEAFRVKLKLCLSYWVVPCLPLWKYQ